MQLTRRLPNKRQAVLLCTGGVCAILLLAVILLVVVPLVAAYSQQLLFEQRANEFVTNFDQHMRDSRARNGEFRVIVEQADGIYITPVDRKIVDDEGNTTFMWPSDGESHKEVVVYGAFTLVGQELDRITIWAKPGDDVLLSYTTQEGFLVHKDSYIPVQ